jgi:hypothetical protein
LIKEALYPSDSYTPDGTYWADLPTAQRWKFATTQFNQESRREVKYVWDMFKRDPMQPFRAYWRKYVLTGMGLFVEGAFRRFLSLEVDLRFERVRLSHACSAR